MKHRIALMLALAAVAAVTALMPARAGAAHHTTRVQKVTVSMYDFRFKLSVAKFPAGKVTFLVVNRGKSIHNFSIPGVHTSPFLQPGGKNTFTITVKKGAHRYVCTVPRHAELGMFGQLTAT